MPLTEARAHAHAHARTHVHVHTQMCARTHAHSYVPLTDFTSTLRSHRACSLLKFGGVGACTASLRSGRGDDVLFSEQFKMLWVHFSQLTVS